MIQGNSATGKTTMVDMLLDYNRYSSDTGITLQCDKTVRVISGNAWKDQLDSMVEESIILIDEGNRFAVSKEFAEEISM